jgi:hypothetical protein
MPNARADAVPSRRPPGRDGISREIAGKPLTAIDKCCAGCDDWSCTSS